MPWSLHALLAAAGIRADAPADAPIEGLSCDSRAVGAGDLFCCIPGAIVDGHDFASQAAAAGAAALLTERPVDVPLPAARVDRVRPVLGPLADAFFDRPSSKLRVAGVTGTNGKTTVTYLLESIVEAAGLSPGVVGTVRYRFADTEEPAVRTTPEAIDLHRLLARMAGAGIDVVAMEVASHALDQDRVGAIRFACGAFTNLTQDHLDYHKDMESYFEAKARLFTQTSKAAINTSDPYGRRLRDRCRDLDVLTYAGDGADVRAEKIEQRVDGTRATIHTPNGSFDMSSRLVGSYNVDNVLCVVAVSLFLELDVGAMARGIEKLQRVPGRLEAVITRPFTVLVDYAHTPDALKRVLQAARAQTSGRVIAVFGCGGDRDRAKRPLMGEVATRTADLTIVTSDNPRSEDPMSIIEEVLEGAGRGPGEHLVVPDRREAIAQAMRAAGSGDVVVVAGKGHEQGQTFADRTIPFDDREVVSELAEELRCRS